MIKIKTVLTIMLFLNIITFDIVASDKYQIGVSEIPSLLNYQEKTPGSYNYVLRELSDIELVFIPPARSVHMFNQKKLDCLFPASTQTILGTHNLVESTPIQVAKAFLFTNKPYQSFNEFSDKTIAIRRGFSYGNIRKNFKTKFIELDSHNAVVKFFLLGRADGFIAYLTDTQSAYLHLNNNLSSSGTFYNPEQAIYAARESFVCHQNEKNKRFIENVSKRIDHWKKNGRLKKWLAIKLN